MDLNHIKSVYFIGIKGAGMTALAEFLSLRGIYVTGSDVSEVFFTDAVLQKQGIHYYDEFSTTNVPEDVDIVIFSTAYTEDHVEIKKARTLGHTLLSYPEALGLLFNSSINGLVVCGTHGKTTTSALLAHVLFVSGRDPSAIIGGHVLKWNGNTLSGKGEHFVLEADEYQNKLHYYKPQSVILTSVDWDHPDYFTDFKKYKDVFKRFVMRIPHSGNLVACGDSDSVLEVMSVFSGQSSTYGFLEHNDFHITKHLLSNSSHDVMSFFQTFHIVYKDKDLGQFHINLPGRHNVLNAASVIALCFLLGIPIGAISEGLKDFTGTSRRFESHGMYKEVFLIDDYAHHPTEVSATLSAVRSLWPDKKVWAVFHPHTYSRTEKLFAGFSTCFLLADHVLVLDIYGSARENRGTVSSQDLVLAINKNTPGRATYIPTISGVVDFLQDAITRGDIVITLGAGDVWKLHDLLKK